MVEMYSARLRGFPKKQIYTQASPNEKADFQDYKQAQHTSTTRFYHANLYKRQKRRIENIRFLTRTFYIKTYFWSCVLEERKMVNGVQASVFYLRWHLN